MSRYVYKKLYQWNADIAYLAGLIASDGCLYKDGRHLNVTSKDWEVIENVQRIADTHGKVPTKMSMYGSEAYNLQFSNVALYDFLLQAGITPAKSKTIGKLLIPDLFYADFLRGYFDGDGTIWGYWDKRWSNSLMYYTAFTSASPPFLVWLQAMNVKLALTSPGKIKPGERAANLTYAKADSWQLFKFMYHAEGLPMLTRKHTKFVAFLRAEPYPSKELNARVL